MLHDVKCVPLKHGHFKESGLLVSNTYQTLAQHLSIRIGHTKIVSDFKNLKTCVSKLYLLSKSHRSCVRTMTLLKSHRNHVLSTEKLYIVKKISFDIK